MIRHALLEESLIEANVSNEHRERWPRYDIGMKTAIIKETVDECEGRYKTEKVLAVPKPS